MAFWTLFSIPEQGIVSISQICSFLIPGTPVLRLETRSTRKGGKLLGAQLCKSKQDIQCLYQGTRL
jgi:hypothetical protein